MSPKSAIPRLVVFFLVSLVSTAVVNRPLRVPAVLDLIPATGLQAAPSEVQFEYTFGGPLPLSQIVNLFNNGPVVNYTALVLPGALWLSIDGGAIGRTPGAFSLKVNPTGLPPGIYAGRVSVTAGTNPATLIPVTLRVLWAALQAAPQELSIVYQLSGPLPFGRAIRIFTTGSPVLISTTASSNGNWLSISSAAFTPAVLNIFVNPIGLNPGTYDGVITVTAPGATGSPLYIPVTLIVTGSPVLQSDPTSMTFLYQINGQVPVPQTLTVASNGVPLLIPAAHATSEEGRWLQVTGGGATPVVFNVAVDPAGLAPGSYRGDIILLAAGALNRLDIPVRLIVFPAPLVPPNPLPQLNVDPTALAFAFRSGDPSPAEQVITVDSFPRGLSYSVEVTGADWLSASPPAETTPATETIRVDPAGLSPGDYRGSVVLTPSGSTNSVTVPVSFAVSDRVTLTISPSLVSFLYNSGDPIPAPRVVAVATAPEPLPLTVQASDPWISAIPEGAPGRRTISILVDPRGLVAGYYLGTVHVFADPAPPADILVELLVVDVPDNGTFPVITSIVNAASFLPGPLAPGMTFTLLGDRMGPANGVFASPGLSNIVTTYLGGTQVFVNGVPCPLLFVQNGQINAVAPFALAGHTDAWVEVQYLGRRSAAFPVTVTGIGADGHPIRRRTSGRQDR